LNKNEKFYPRSGGRGIKICDEWLKFEGFYKDMGSTYLKGLTLERIDNNGNYEKDNCKWIASAEQSRNRRNVKLYEYNGSKLNIPEIAKIIGLKVATLEARIRDRGWSFEKAVTTPNRNKIAKGYIFDRARNKYRVEVCIKGKKRMVGRFNTPEEALRARKACLARVAE
jgi:hypothetical protein